MITGPGNRAKKVTVLGLGNELMSDDGVGIHVVRQLPKCLPASVSCVEVGTAALRAQRILEESDCVIAVDAIQADGPPGSLYVVEGMPMPMLRTESVHHMSLFDVLCLVAPSLRPDIVIVGVEPERVECGMALSETVNRRIPAILDTVRRVVQGVHRDGLAVRDAVAQCM